MASRDPSAACDCHFHEHQVCDVCQGIDPANPPKDHDAANEPYKDAADVCKCFPTLPRHAVCDRCYRGDHGLLRVKRAWVPEWLWRLFCIGNLATFTPWREILTRRVVEADRG